EIDVGETAVTPGERHPHSLSSHESALAFSPLPARQPSAVAIDKGHGAIVLVCAMACAGLALSILVFHPGYLTRGATFVRNYVETWHLGDWQSPLMTIVWWLIDPISPGTGSMFLVTATLYWLGFAVPALVVARRSSGLAIAVELLALAPP